MVSFLCLSIILSGSLSFLTNTVFFKVLIIMKVLEFSLLEQGQCRFTPLKYSLIFQQVLHLQVGWWKKTLTLTFLPVLVSTGEVVHLDVHEHLQQVGSCLDRKITK